MRKMLWNRLRLAAVGVLVTLITFTSGAPISAAHAASSVVPQFNHCQVFDIVQLDAKTTTVGSSGTLEIQLFRRDDAQLGDVCSYYAVATETHGPSGTLTATITDFSCNVDHSSSTSSTGNASVQSPNSAANNAPDLATATLGNTSISTICTS